jgi:acyl-CoA thioester hydrolase
MTRHIGHNAIPVWLEEGYAEILQLFNQDLSQPSLIMVNLNMDFMKEIFLGKNVEVLTGVKKIGSSSFVLHSEIHQEGALCVRGSTTFVHFNYVTHKPVSIPPSAIEMLKEHLLPS